MDSAPAVPMHGSGHSVAASQAPGAYWPPTLWRALLAHLPARLQPPKAPSSHSPFLLPGLPEELRAPFLSLLGAPGSSGRQAPNLAPHGT